MANQWFRLYAEFATDPKVQMMSESMQRRYIMLLCMRCSNSLVTLQDEEVAFQLRITAEELTETKALFIKKGFITSTWDLPNWEKRQFASDTSAARVAKHRALQKVKQEAPSNDDVTLQKQKCNALEQNRTEQIGTNVPVAESDPLPKIQSSSVVEIYHEVLPELPKVKILDDKRKKAIGSFCKWVLTSKRSDGQRRATTGEEAIDWIRAYFDRARSNDFLMGRGTKAPGHENWECDIDFLMSDKGKKHVIEKTKDAA